MGSTEPQICSVECGADAASVHLIAHERLEYFVGHFRGHELLAGVVQVKWAIDLARTHLNIPGVVCELKSVKFMRVIQPGAALQLRLRWRAARGELAFEYAEQGETCSLGVVRFESAA